ncbi:PA0069 family radical SAM protein [Vibrio rumoiensis]|uniref:PA0069 family radical SAM protein n=1 Tax=Vibrio rumoiensis TaxID=76258 RepID=UPI00374A69C9
MPWSKSINPYAGCEHGCSYCYARPTHGYHQLSPGLDFETRLFAKMNVAEILETQLGAASYQPTTIVLGTNTDVYQPIERKYRLTRSLLEVCLEFGQPISILTKNSLIERDIDLLRELALLNLIEVHFTLTTLSTSLSQILEPRASLPNSRLKSIKTLTEAGIPVKVMCAPLIPKLNMMELKALMIAAKNVGATDFGYILLRLPFEVEGIFNDWLSTHFPNKHQEVLEALLRYRSNNNYTHRMEGSGYLAQTLKERFQHHYQALGYKTTSPDELNITSFKHRHYRGQLMLFK